MALASTERAFFPRSRIAVSAAFFANGLVLGSWAPQIPLFKDRVGIDESMLGLVILVFGLGSLAAMPLVGGFVARGGSRLPVLALQALLCAALPFLALTSDLAFAFPAAFFFGATLGGMDVAMNANAVATERGMDRAIMSSCHGFWSIGGFVGSGAGGWLIEGLGTSGHAFLVGVVTLALLSPVAFGMVRDAPQAEPALEPGDGGLKGLWIAARRDRAPMLAALVIGIFALFAMVPEGAAIDWSALYLTDDLGADVQTSGLAFAAFSAAMAIFRFMGDAIRDRYGAVRTVRVSLVLGILGLGLVAGATGVPMALVGFAILGVGLSNVVPVAFSAAGNVPGLKPGVGIALATTLGYSGILVAPSAIGFFADRVGFPAVFAALSVLLVLVFLGSNAMRGADRPRG